MRLTICPVAIDELKKGAWGGACVCVVPVCHGICSLILRPDLQRH